MIWEGMSGMQSWLVAQREIREVFSDSKFLISILITGIGLPAFYAYIGMQNAALGQAGVTSSMFTVWFMFVSILPATFSVQLAVTSFVGEKENRTIEPLLAAPISDRELFLGKVLASFVPPLALVALVQVVFLGTSYALAMYRYQIPFHPDLQVVAFMAAFAPLVILFMVGAGVILSARATSVKTAQQMTVFVTLPVLFGVLFKAEAIFQLAVNQPLEALVATVAVDALFLRAGVRLFKREKILSQVG